MALLIIKNKKEKIIKYGPHLWQINDKCWKLFRSNVTQSIYNGTKLCCSTVLVFFWFNYKTVLIVGHKMEKKNTCFQDVNI